jgi:hypothetical protein
LHQEIAAVKPRESNFILISKIIEAEHPVKRTTIVGLDDCNTYSVLKRIIALAELFSQLELHCCTVPVYTQMLNVISVSTSFLDNIQTTQQLVKNSLLVLHSHGTIT